MHLGRDGVVSEARCGGGIGRSDAVRMNAEPPTRSLVASRNFNCCCFRLGEADERKDFLDFEAFAGRAGPATP